MNWMNFALIAGGLLESLVVGLIVGRVVAGIKYPNPDKPHIFTPKQSAILLVAVLVAIALVIFAILYQPKPQTAGDDPLVGTDGMMGPDGMMNDPAVGLPQDGLKEGDPAPVDVMPGGGEDLPNLLTYLTAKAKKRDRTEKIPLETEPILTRSSQTKRKILSLNLVNSFFIW